MLTTVIEVTTTDDTIANDGVTSLREAVIQAHQSSDSDVLIELDGQSTYKITRPTNPPPRLTEGTAEDPNHGDFDITRDLTIRGFGATIDANQLGRAFEISGGVDVTLQGVNIRNGRTAVSLNDSDLQGGAIRADNEGGSLTLINGSLKFNEVSSLSSGDQGDDAYGGAIYVFGGSVSIDNVDIESNKATAGDGINSGDGGDAFGGAIYAEEVSVSIRNSTKLRENQAIGGAGGVADSRGGIGGSAHGGAIFLKSGSMNVGGGISFDANSANAGAGGNSNDGPGGRGGSAFGGAIRLEGAVNTHSNIALISETEIDAWRATFANNVADAGKGGDGNEGGSGGLAEGGAISAGNRVLTKLDEIEFNDNQARGGTGGRARGVQYVGRGGNSRGGAVASWGELQLVDVEMTDNSSYGGIAGIYRHENESSAGGDAFGGAIFADWADRLGDIPIGNTTTTPNISITSSNIIDNFARGANASDGFGTIGHASSYANIDLVTGADGGNGYGGGAYFGSIIDSATIHSSEISDNKAEGGNGARQFAMGRGAQGGEARGGGIRSRASELSIDDTKLRSNSATGGNGGGTYSGKPGHGGNAYGGAIDNDGRLTIDGTLDLPDPTASDGTITSSIAGNQARGGRGGGRRTSRRGDFNCADVDRNLNHISINCSTSLHNRRAGKGGDAFGGAIRADGDLASVVDTLFADNRSLGGEGGDGVRDSDGFNTDAGSNGNAFGGAIHASDRLRVQNSVFVLNQAIGADLNVSDMTAGTAGGDVFQAGGGGSAHGGAISAADTVRVWDSFLAFNSAVGGYGGRKTNAFGSAGRGGDASGGALHVDVFSDVTIIVDSTVLQSNVAVGGLGGGADDASDANDSNPRWGAAAGRGGDAWGGAMSVRDLHSSAPRATVRIVESTISDNKVVGGDGGHAGSGSGTSYPDPAEAVGGSGGDGGDGGNASGGGTYLQNVNTDGQTKQHRGQSRQQWLGRKRRPRRRFGRIWRRWRTGWPCRHSRWWRYRTYRRHARNREFNHRDECRHWRNGRIRWLWSIRKCGW